MAIKLNISKRPATIICGCLLAAAVTTVHGFSVVPRATLTQAPSTYYGTGSIMLHAQEQNEQEPEPTFETTALNAMDEVIMEQTIVSGPSIIGAAAVGIIGLRNQLISTKRDREALEKSNATYLYVTQRKTKAKGLPSNKRSAQNIALVRSISSKPAPKKNVVPKKRIVKKPKAVAKKAVKKAAKKAAKKPVAKKAVKKPVAKKVVAKKAAPKKVVAKKAAPKKVVAKKAAPKKVVAKKAAPKKVVSNKAAPKAVAKKAAPKKAAPKKAAPKVAPKKVAAKKVAKK